MSGNEPVPDAQGQIYREAQPDSAVWDPGLTSRTAGAVLHPAGEGVYHYKTPNDYEAENWDAGREGPKNLEEAKAALSARISDPAAPDGEEVRGAYDNEESDEYREEDV